MIQQLGMNVLSIHTGKGLYVLAYRLVYIDVKNGRSEIKNTAPQEAEEIVRLAILHNDKQIGVITPFVNEKDVATSRAKDKRIVLSDSRNLARLHRKEGEDDLFELVEYMKKNGESKVTQKPVRNS